MAGRGIHSSLLISPLSIFLRLDSLLIASRGSLLDSGCLLPHVCVPPTSANILDSGSLSATKRFPIRCKRLQQLSFATNDFLPGGSRPASDDTCGSDTSVLANSRCSAFYRCFRTCR
ncbi:uncharacterized protein BCR38DRAFT_101371 [Pseudomassariella vexata]|uniref:Uncharacterized protein n=1 Tax=Pseudomassariella vexata TaxID=1141098 RepID=A0A1Y2EF35_9PEZI|nr:uncharacterized protein BCR38DRAFT_101371 [Pseudomassariella vexata]ORY70181.1 hypothetical protein BCR38DRAFT_101371 [Pseudomassariella vexata]